MRRVLHIAWIGALAMLASMQLTRPSIPLASSAAEVSGMCMAGGADLLRPSQEPFVVNPRFCLGDGTGSACELALRAV